MADHILTESGNRLLTEDGSFLVLALDIIGEDLPAVFRSPARQLVFTARARGLIYIAPHRSMVFISPPRGDL
jgi:hypothetical protein